MLRTGTIPVTDMRSSSSNMVSETMCFALKICSTPVVFRLWTTVLMMITVWPFGSWDSRVSNKQHRIQFGTPIDFVGIVFWLFRRSYPHQLRFVKTTLYYVSNRNFVLVWDNFIKPHVDVHPLFPNNFFLYSAYPYLFIGPFAKLYIVLIFCGNSNCSSPAK